jgi:hypothetical protein
MRANLENNVKIYVTEEGVMDSFGSSQCDTESSGFLKDEVLVDGFRG